jgi:hypothetical protein
MEDETTDILLAYNTLHEYYKIPNPSIEDIAEGLQRLFPGRESYYDLRVGETFFKVKGVNASRVMVHMWRQHEWGAIIDRDLLDSEEMIEVDGDPDHEGEFPIGESITKENAVNSIMRYIHTRETPEELYRWIQKFKPKSEEHE